MGEFFDGAVLFIAVFAGLGVLYVVINAVMDGIDWMVQRPQPVARPAYVQFLPAASQWERCVTCRGRVLVENTTRGVCSDCLALGTTILDGIALHGRSTGPTDAGVG